MVVTRRMAQEEFTPTSNGDSASSETKILTSSTNGSETKILTAAPPPWHSAALLGLFVALFLHMLPDVSHMDAAASIEVFTNRIFEDNMSLKTLGLIRGAIAIFIWSTTLHTLLISPGWVQETAYLPNSKLRKVPNRMSGVKTLFPFTSVSWNLLGIAFTLSSYICFAVDAGHVPPQWVLRLALATWEIAAPFTLLVAAVIRYAIWPGVIKAGGDTTNLKCWRFILMHNTNVLFALMETAFLGGLPVHWSHVSLAPLVGCAYILFSWQMIFCWNERRHGPQFIYYFFDTTLGATTSMAMLVLLIVLMVFYGVFVTAEHVLALVDGGWRVHGLFVVTICSLVMRFHDY